MRSLISEGLEDVVWLEERQLSLPHAQGDVLPARLKKGFHRPSLQIAPKIMSLCSAFPQLPEHLEVWRWSGPGSCEVVASPNRYVPHLGQAQLTPTLLVVQVLCQAGWFPGSSVPCSRSLSNSLSGTLTECFFHGQEKA